jgi:hypothetical protein
MNSMQMLVGAAAAATLLGCTPTAKAPVAAINDKLYTVTPDAMMVKAGILTGQVTEMKVMERVEEGTGRVDTPAKLTGKLVIKNISTDQAVRLVGAKFTYMDLQGKPIVLEDKRAEPLLKMATGYGSSDRLDPGQDTTQMIDVEFPVDALKAKRLKDIRLGLTYLPSPYREETMNFPVSIGGK